MAIDQPHVLCTGQSNQGTLMYYQSQTIYLVMTRKAILPWPVDNTENEVVSLRLAQETTNGAAGVPTRVHTFVIEPKSPWVSLETSAWGTGSCVWMTWKWTTHSIICHVHHHRRRSENESTGGHYCCWGIMPGCSFGEEEDLPVRSPQISCVM
jgi:hypothetical protein